MVMSKNADLDLNFGHSVDYGLDDLGFKQTRDFSVLQNVQTGSGDHATSY